MYMYVYICMYVCMYVYINVYIYVYNNDLYLYIDSILLNYCNTL